MSDWETEVVGFHDNTQGGNGVRTVKNNASHFVASAIATMRFLSFAFVVSRIRAGYKNHSAHLIDLHILTFYIRLEISLALANLAIVITNQIRDTETTSSLARSTSTNCISAAHGRRSRFRPSRLSLPRSCPWISFRREGMA